MSVMIKKQLVTSRKYTYSGTNGRHYITIHETANTSVGANAQAHANLQSNGFSSSFHWQVDDKQAIQSFPHSVQCWHGGDRRGDGNLNSIAIEICVNSDGDFKKAVTNAIALTRKIMKDEGISINNVVQHNRWSGKNCPTNLRNGSKGVNWSDFVNALKGDIVAKEPTKSKPTPKPSPKPSGGNKSYTGGSIVMYLSSIGVDSSYSIREKLAKQYGVSNYRGTAKQNTELLNKMRKGSPAKSKPQPSKSTAQMAKEVFDGKHGNGHANRQKSLGVNAATYAKVRAEVNKLAGGKAPVAKPKGKSISQMATEVIAGKHGNGHANRRKSLGITQSEYNKVRAEVNKRL